MKKENTLARRSFLQTTASGLAGATLATALDALAARAETNADVRFAQGYGQLRPVRDESSGLPLLLLPEGFRYTTFGWTGSALDGGYRTPTMHDGMAVIRAEGSLVTLCRNHEIDAAGQRPIGDPATSYDAHGGGGCTNLLFDTEAGRLVRSWVSLSGTSRNCAGGPTPWGTWLSCEETVAGAGDRSLASLADDSPDDGGPQFAQSHGWIFEVPAEGASEPVPLRDMGRFVHEAVAVDPETGHVYETEDRDTAGCYRFLPNKPGQLADGGRLQMMQVVGQSDLRGGFERGAKFDVAWVDIDDPYRPHSPESTDTLGVYQQGIAAGGSTFVRLEGCWQAGGAIHLTATSGGAARLGQVWRYWPADEVLELLFESPSPDVLSAPDNITVSPRGLVVICEDCDTAPDRLICLDPDGALFPLAENNVVLHGERGHRGDFRTREWAGATFSPDGKWLFANIQTPGITFAITGPW